MFKHKIIKYFLISALILFALVFIVILRLSHKPLDITYFSNAYPSLNKKVLELYDIKSKKIYLKLNLLENKLSLKIDNIFLQNLNSKISNVKAKEANITFKLTDIIKNNIEAKNITISEGGLDIYDIESLGKVYLDEPNKTYDFDNIIFEKININVYEKNKKVALLTNCNLTLTKKKEGIHINDLLIENLVLKDFNTNNHYIINNLKLIKKNQSNYSFKIETIELQNGKYVFQNKYFKNIDNIMLKNIVFDFDINSFLTNVKGQILYNKYENNFVVKGILNRFKIFNGELTVDIESFPMFNLLKNNFFTENKYKINNISSILFSGKLKAEIKDNILDKTTINIYSQLYERDILLKNLKNNSTINIEDISFEGQINKNIYEIKKLNINKDNQNLNIAGKFNNDIKNFFLNINADKFKYNKVNKLLNNSLDAELNYFDEISSIDIDQVKKLKLIFSKNNNKTELNIINSEFEDIRLLTHKNMILNISSAKIIKTNKKIKFFSSDIKVKGIIGSAYFSKLSILSNDYTDIINDIELNSDIITNYKFLNFMLSEFKINQKLPKNLEGDVSGLLKISKKKKDKDFIYLFEGFLENFNYNKPDNKNMPIVLKGFSGDFSLSNDLIKINGVGSINGSSSEIKILVDKNDILTANIEAKAKPSSFNFLGKYNFVKNGNSILKILITKNINSKKWKAKFNANLFSNEIKIDFINFHKPINRRGNISGVLQFSDLELISADEIDFFTEQVLIDANLLFKGKNELENILINSFIRDKNNFKANIKFLDSGYHKVKIEGESLDFYSLRSYGSGEPLNIIFNLNVNNVYYDNIYLGNIFFNSKIKNNQFIKLKGNISNDNSAYIRFENILSEKSEYNNIKIEFDDFGNFLNKASISEVFLKGEGNATLYFRKLNLLSGKLEIANSSVKNNSFLARLLQLASFTGLLEILTKEGIPFDKIIVNFTKKDSVINIEEAKFQGFSLGGKLKGFAELNKKELNLEGIIIPAYAINSFLNKIPLIGQVITGVEGDGLIGVNFKVTGNYEKPNYNVNPLSILTPGILRSIFDSFFEVNDKNKTIE